MRSAKHRRRRLSGIGGKCVSRGRHVGRRACVCVVRNESPARRAEREQSDGGDSHKPRRYHAIERALGRNRSALARKKSIITLLDRAT